MKLVAWVLLASLAGCATVKDVAQGPHGFAICKTADLATTTYALHHGAVETGLIMKPVVASLGYAGLWGVGLGLIWLAYHYQDKIPKPVFLAVNGVTCAAAVSNLIVIRNMAE